MALPDDIARPRMTAPPGTTYDTERSRIEVHAGDSDPEFGGT